MDEFFSCVGKRTRRQRELLGLLLPGSSPGADMKRPSGSRASSKSKVGQRRRRRSESWGVGDTDPDDVILCVSEEEGDNDNEQRGFSGSRRKGMRLEKRVGVGEDDDVVFLGERVDEGAGPSVSGRRGLSMGHDQHIDGEDDQSVEVIVIDDSTEEELEHSAVGVDEEDQDCSGFDFDDDNGLLSSTDSEDDEISDEDFKVDETERSSSEDGSVSYDDEDGDDGEEEEEEKEGKDGSGSRKACGKRKEESIKTKKFECSDEETSLMETTGIRPMVEEQGRKVQSESSGICRNINGDCNDNVIVHDFPREKKASETVSSKSLGRKDKEVEEGESEEDTPYSVKNDECGEKGKEQDQKGRKGADCYATGELHMKGCSTNLHEEEAKKAEKLQQIGRVQRADQSFSADVDVFGDHLESLGCCKPSKDEAEKDKKKQEGTGGENSFDILSRGDAKRVQNEYTRRGHHSCSLQKERRDSAQILKGKENQGEIGDKKETLKNYANANDTVNLDDAYKRKEHPDKGTSLRSVSSLLKSQEETGDSPKIDKIMKTQKVRELKKETRENEDKVNDSVYLNAQGRKDHADIRKSEKVHKIQIKQAKPKEFHLIELLAECFGAKCNANRDFSNEFEEKDNGVHQQHTEPPAGGETLPLKFTFGVDKTPPVEKSESQKEIDMLWEEMESLLKFEEIGSLVGNARTNEAGQCRGSTGTLCKHDFYLDEEIGIYCRICSWIATEIKYVSPPVEDSPLGGSRKRISSDGVNASLFDEVNGSGDGSVSACTHNEGTVWDIIPGIKESMYPHQQEGFEFIWTNLAGTIDLHTLKSADPSSAGGCIISHAPGTGKTRLTIVFLQTYLEVFPKCRPVVIAPASLLLTWEDEFKKWDIGIPFHNMNNLELSGKEHVSVINKVDRYRRPIENKDSIRMAKLVSWYKERSILGISYNLYEKLAGEKSKVGVENKKKNGSMKARKRHSPMKENLESEVMGKVLRDFPGLLVLDEGHTPRNQRSLIWKVLLEIQTEKRIILSGTPFQNNFLELYNTLCLVKPSFPERIPQELKKFCQSKKVQEKKASEGVRWEQVSPGSSIGFPADEKIHQLKLLMDPFVNVHKGSILQKKLPGLRGCVVTLKPDNLQKALLQCIECSKKTFEFEHKLALVSIHPSLFLRCSLSKKEESVVDRERLEELKLNPYGGVKTRFLVEFVRLCEAFNEKVLVFSQYIDPLCLIRDQLKSIFNWSEGKEVLHMHGKLDQKQRQTLIHGFNDANSQAKILLASTKACSEGINLVGASRVVLLDVVWNSSVERQAISRAYRLGQRRVVYTYHLITQATTECTKYCKQAEKDRISELVFSARITENDEQKNGSTVVSEDKVLDQMVQHDRLKDMFGDCGLLQKERELFETFGS